MMRVLAKDFARNVANLPRLPIPAVTDTISRYRDSVMPFKKNLQKKHFEKLAAFENSANELQKKLIAADAAAAAEGGYPHSYVEKLWDDGYLAFRGPNPINIAPAFSFKPLGKNLSQAEAATAVVDSILKWITKVTTAGLDVPTPVDVSQMQFQFSFSRIPDPVRDRLASYPLEEARHITVLRGGHPFVVRVFDDNRQAVSKAKLQEAFQQILSLTPPEEDNAAPVSVLTAGGRSDWAASYAELIQDSQNQLALEKIQRSIIVVCLDAQEWKSNVTVKQQAMLFGGTEEIENRWYDKHQIIVSADGQVAANFEHAFSDGLTWSRWLREVCCNVQSEKCEFEPLPELVRSNEPASVELLKITFGKTFVTTIRTAKKQTRKLVSGISLDFAHIPIGKADLKLLKFSPDAFVQTCLHMAYFQLRSKIAPTYESCSTSKFFHGRTETIRTATQDMWNFISEEAKTTSPSGELKALAITAAKTHISLARAAAEGQGIDRHLLALKDIARSANDAVATDFFNDDLYGYSGTWLMSTSNVSQPHMELFNFGPVSNDGYGIGYVIDENDIRVTISAFTSSSKTNSTDMATAVVAAATRLLSIIKVE